LGLEDHGYRTVLNTGAGGGQEVPYLHAHILSGRNFTWPPG
jgi:histidine triad (HIT) family protein